MTKRHKTTKAGYMRFAKDKDGRLRMEHSLVWEKHHGAIPAGMQIHHKDLDKTNNDISNLEVVTPLDHKRLHTGCKKIGDQWIKPCKVCGEYKHCNKDNWYYSRGCITGKICKTCFIQKSLQVRARLIANGWKRKNYPCKKQESAI